MSSLASLQGIVATCADLSLLGVGGLAGLLGLFSRRRAPKPATAYLVVSGKRFPLNEPIRLGRASWYRLTGKSVADLAEEHAEIFRAPSGMWEARLLDGEHMFVDGRRSRHNRLRSGATISLGKSQQVVFQFVLQN